MLKRLFRGNDRNIKKNGYLWNSAAGLVNAAQSVFILILIMRMMGSTDAGIFSLAFATANMMLFIGKYGVRNYQVTDYTEKYSFSDYLTNRVITTIAMILASAGYCVYAGLRLDYTLSKGLVIFFMCMLKVVDSVTDVYESRLQQKERIDIASRLYVFRTVVSIVLLLIVLFVTRNLLVATIAGFLTATLISVITYGSIMKDFVKNRLTFDREKQLRILMVCFPLFVYGFCNMYLTNAPKYAIDATLGDEVQAAYGIIAMPVFVVNLLAQFVYQPILPSLGEDFTKKRYESLLQKIVRQTVIVAGITLVCIAGAWVLGIPVFNWMYKTDVSAYKAGLLLLLVGGGGQALCSLYTSALTVIRYQQKITVIYAIFSVIALFCFTPIVRRFGVDGGCICYLVLVLLISAILGAMFVWKLNQLKKQRDKGE